MAGLLIQGSLYRGGYDMFDWTREGATEATMRFRQDGRTHRLRWTTCSPSRGFHACIELSGEPSIAGRYQTRDRWVLRGAPASEGAEGAFFVAAWSELAPEVEAALDDVAP